jgi:threonine dehydrogenase-like Zn-dependent dehydrogenase
MRNGWLTSDGRTLVAVYAGSAGDDPAVGRLVIVRQNLVSGSQTVRIVGTGTTGALAIAAAPLGRPAETAALQIRTAGRRLLRLDLGTDEVGAG